MIQLSNVCSISTYIFVQANPFPTQSLILGGLGLATLFIKLVIGIVLLIVFGVWIYIGK